MIRSLAPYALGAVVVIAIAASLYGWGHRAGRAGCEAAIKAAQIESMAIAAKAVAEQRAKVSALDAANKTLKDDLDDMLSAPRDACRLPDNVRERLLRLRP